MGINGLKHVPKNATKFVIDVAIIAPDAFLRVYATRPPKFFLKIGICADYFQVSLNKKVLSAPIPRTINTTKMWRRQKNGIRRNIL